MSERDAETPPLQPISRKISISTISSDSDTLFEEGISPKQDRPLVIFKGPGSEVNIEKGEEKEEKRTREEFCSRPRLTATQWSQGLQEHLAISQNIARFKALGFSNDRIAEEITEYCYMDDYHAHDLPGMRRVKET